MNSRTAETMAEFQTACPPSGRIIGLFPDLLGVGGVQEAGRLTAAALLDIAVRRGATADFLSLNDSDDLHMLESNKRAIPVRGFGRGKIRFVLYGMGRARSKSNDGPRVTVAGHPHLAVPAALMQGASRKLKSIVIAHGIEVWKLLAPVRRRALLRANAVLAPSRDTARKLADIQGVAPEKIHVLPWPLNPDFLQMASGTAALRLPAQFPGGRIILTVGRWAACERYKGADELIRAVAQLLPHYPDLRLVAVGGGDELPRLMDFAASLKVADRVHFFPSLSRHQVAACYSQADIFALPSTGEGFGLVFLEAMAFGKPVVGAACGGTTDVIADGINGFLVPPHNSLELAGALEALLRDDSLRSRLGRTGSEIVRSKYCFSVFETELEHILASTDSL